MDKVIYDPIVFVGDPIEVTFNKMNTKFQLHTIRKKHKLSQKKVSELTGLSTKCISCMESPEYGNPTLDSLIRYLDCFGYELLIKKKTI